MCFETHQQVLRRLAVLLTALVGGAGCGELAGFDVVLPPVLEIDAALLASPAELDALIESYRGRPADPASSPESWTVHAALLWVTAPHLSELCADARLAASGACLPPSFVAPYRAGRATSFTEGSTVHLESATLPPLGAGVDIGSDRLTFGSAVLFLDTNADRQYDPWDRVLAASWYDDALAHTRISVREGASPSLPLEEYYPLAPSCPALPRGVSFVEWSPDADACRVEPPASTPVPMRLLTAAEETMFQCGWNDFGAFTFDPYAFDFEVQPELLDGAVCLSPDVLILARPSELTSGTYVPGETDDPRFVFGERACPQLLRVALRACYDENYCDDFDWDYTASPPPGWPC